MNQPKLSSVLVRGSYRKAVTGAYIPLRQPFLSMMKRQPQSQMRYRRKHYQVDFPIMMSIRMAWATILLLVFLCGCAHREGDDGDGIGIFAIARMEILCRLNTIR
jgi:hypothetical protein